MITEIHTNKPRYTKCTNQHNNNPTLLSNSNISDIFLTAFSLGYHQFNEKMIFIIITYSHYEMV